MISNEHYPHRVHAHLLRHDLALHPLLREAEWREAELVEKSVLTAPHTLTPGEESRSESQGSQGGGGGGEWCMREGHQDLGGLPCRV